MCETTDGSPRSMVVFHVHSTVEKLFRKAWAVVTSAHCSECVALAVFQALSMTLCFQQVSKDKQGIPVEELTHCSSDLAKVSSAVAGTLSSCKTCCVLRHDRD